MYSRILVPIDGSEASTLGLAEAIKVAKSLGGTIRLLTVVNDLIMMSGADVAVGFVEVIAALRERGKKLLEETTTSVRSAGVEVDAKLEEIMGGQVGTLIVKHAGEWRADLIVMGTHGRRGIRRMVLGSDAEYVVRHTPVPVLLVRSPHPPEG